MQSFLGSFTHNLDAKSRLFMPAKFRDGLTGTFVINLLDSEYPCIQCFQTKDFYAFADAALEGYTDPVQRRKVQFRHFGAASEVTVDAQGRINIPAQTAARANLKKEAIIVGMGDHVEIWDPETFDAYYAFVNSSSIEYEKASEAEYAISLEKKAKGEYLPG